MHRRDACATNPNGLGRGPAKVRDPGEKRPWPSPAIFSATADNANLSFEGDTKQVLAEDQAGIHDAGLHRDIKPQGSPDNLP
jgi:hypothetical protein